MSQKTLEPTFEREVQRRVAVFGAGAASPDISQRGTKRGEVATSDMFDFAILTAVDMAKRGQYDLAIEALEQATHQLRLKSLAMRSGQDGTVLNAEAAEAGE